MRTTQRTSVPCRLFLTAIVVCVLGAARADDPPSSAGTMRYGSKKTALKHFVAYERKNSDETRMVLLSSDRPIKAADIQKVLDENDGSDDTLRLNQTFLKVIFSPEGEVENCSAETETGFFNTSSDLSGEMVRSGDRIHGKVTLSPPKSSRLDADVQLEFNVPLLGSKEAAAELARPKPPREPVKPNVTGFFKGNGKDAKLAFISASTREPFNDQNTILILLTQKDHSKDQKPDFNANFGRFGNALIISCFEDGRIFGCQVVHEAHGDRQGFSSVGAIRIHEFDYEGGQLTGTVKTDGEQEFFGQTWEVELKIAASVIATPGIESATQKPESETPKVSARKTRKKERDSSSKSATKKAAPPAAKLKIKELAIFEGQEDVQYKKLVEQAAFASDKNYKLLAKDLIKKLDDQGWESDGSDLIGVSAIIKRKKDGAELTIFVKPSGNGSTVTVMTEGLDWDD
jgi:hypothetical protein